MSIFWASSGCSTVSLHFGHFQALTDILSTTTFALPILQLSFWQRCSASQMSRFIFITICHSQSPSSSSPFSRNLLASHKRPYKGISHQILSKMDFLTLLKSGNSPITKPPKSGFHDFSFSSSLTIKSFRLNNSPYFFSFLFTSLVSSLAPLLNKNQIS